MAGNRAAAKAGIAMDRSVRCERALEPSIGPSREPYACTTEPSTGRYTTLPPRGSACGSGEVLDGRGGRANRKEAAKAHHRPRRRGARRVGGLGGQANTYTRRLTALCVESG